MSGCICGGGRGTHRADCTEKRLCALERVAHKPQPVVTRAELAALLRAAMAHEASHTLHRLLQLLEEK